MAQALQAERRRSRRTAGGYRVASVGFGWEPQFEDLTPTLVWEPQPGPQTALLALPPSIHECFFGGARGGGKEQPRDALVLTFDGWVQIGSLQVGDEVCD